MTAASASAWDARFATRSPMFEPYERVAAGWQASSTFPDRVALAAALAAWGPVTNAAGRQLVPGAPAGAGGALAYERAIGADAVLGMREHDWHDLLNLLVWCVFPATKARLNAGHVEAAGSPGGGRRSARRDALTLFDENGLLVASADPSLEHLLRTFRWRELFVERRADVVRAMRFLVVGHGLLDKARAPFVGLTAHALVLQVQPAGLERPSAALAASLDGRLASAIDQLCGPRELAPVPVLGVPGWWPANEAPAFYEDTRYFRPGRQS
jgi:hypothetical protein